MVTLKFRRNMCHCDSYYTEIGKTIYIGTRYCYAEERLCFPRVLPSTLAHEIGHAMLKHRLSDGKDTIIHETEAWAFAINKAKVDKKTAKKCLMLCGEALKNKAYARMACRLLGA